MSERWPLTIVKANRVSPLGYILCIPLVMCQSEIIASDSSSNLIHHAIEDIIYCSNFCYHVLTQRLAAVATSISPLSDPRDN